jgi:hypothetical protein
MDGLDGSATRAPVDQALDALERALLVPVKDPTLHCAALPVVLTNRKGTSEGLEGGEGGAAKDGTQQVP